MLMGWIDTIRDNYPCLPPTFERCLDAELLDVLMATAIRLAPVAGKVFK